MRIGRHQRSWFVAVGIVIIAILITIAITPHEPTLLERATKIGAISPIPPGNYWYPGGYRYRWVSQNQIMIPHDHNWYKRDLIHGTETPVGDPNWLFGWSNEVHDFMDAELEFDLALLKAIPVSSMKGWQYSGWLGRVLKHLPARAEVLDVVFSPNHRRIGWLLQEKSTIPWEACLHRIVPAYQPHVRTNLVLYTSDRDGGHMHEIGRQTLPDAPVKRTGAFSTPYNLQWAPGGKRLSFVYRNSVWTIPAD